MMTAREISRLFYRFKCAAIFGFVALLLLSFSVQNSHARKAWYEDYGIQSKVLLTSPASVPALMLALDSRNANIRKGAAKALGQIGEEAHEALPLLLKKVETEPHPRVKAEIIKSLAAIELSPEVIRLCLKLLDDKDANIRKMALTVLGRSGYRGADLHAAVGKMAQSDPHRNVKALAVKTLETLKSDPVASVATTRLPRTSSEHRYSVAVIIGNRNYKHNNKDVPDVDYAHNDAQAMYDYVTKTLGYQSGNILYLKDATQAELVSTFGSVNNPKGQLYDWVRANQSDVFIYYSGHGAPGLSDGRGYLLPVDANPQKVELNGYALDTFYANLARVPARKTTIILDACFSGVSANGAVVRNASSISLKMRKPKLLNAKETVVLTAAGLSEVASWDTSSQHGLFTSHFLKGVHGGADGDRYGNGDGKITLGELKKYLKEEVTYNARRMYGRTQNPQISGNPKVVVLAE